MPDSCSRVGRTLPAEPETFSVRPNPANERITVFRSQPGPAASLVVYDASGRLVATETIPAGALETALELLLDANTPFYQLTCERISLTGINLLKAIARGETKLTSMDVMQSYRLGTPRNVQKAREVLEANDVIERVKDGWGFLDPGLELWFRREFMDQPAVVAG